MAVSQSLGLYDRPVRAFDPQHTPQELRPARVNTKALFLVGSVGWLVAMLVVVALLASGRTLDERLVPLCVCGLALGLVGTLWAHGQRKRGEM